MILFQKMGIEGAEFSLITEMHEQGLLRHIDQLYMEIHGEKRGFNQEQVNNLIDLIYSNNVVPYL